MPEKPHGSKSTVALISRHPLLRLGLQQVLKSEEGIRFVQGLPGDMNTDELIVQHRPNLVIVDSEVTRDLPTVIRRLRAAQPALKIVLLCTMDQAEQARQTLSLGIDGIVLKVQAAPILIATIRHLLNLPLPHHPENGNLVPKPDRGEAPTATVTRHSVEGRQLDLTARESQIVNLVAEGLSNKEIAERLSMADTTVRHYLTKIFNKLGVSNRQHLLIRAHHHGVE